jgi:hypothetical protein
MAAPTRNLLTLAFSGYERPAADHRLDQTLLREYGEGLADCNEGVA